MRQFSESGTRLKTVSIQKTENRKQKNVFTFRCTAGRGTNSAQDIRLGSLPRLRRWRGVRQQRAYTSAVEKCMSFPTLQDCIGKVLESNSFSTRTGRVQCGDVVVEKKKRSGWERLWSVAFAEIGVNFFFN